MATDQIVPTPQEIASRVTTDYQHYIKEQYRLWGAAGHPDVGPDGKPRRRVLKPAERTALMRERLGAVASYIPENAWHSDCQSPRSSQALFVEVMGVLKEAGLLSVLHPAGLTGGCSIAFEEVHGRTNFDAVLRYADGQVAATIEAKFTEEGFGTCEYPSTGRCDGTWRERPGHHRGCPMATPSRNRATAERYWSTAVRVLGCPEDPPRTPITCPLWASYQMIHNIAETNSANSAAVWTLIYDSRNPYFSDSRAGWVSMLMALRVPVHLLTWQALLLTAAPASARIRRLKEIHGF